jgi:hypothetical protein
MVLPWLLSMLLCALLGCGRSSPSVVQSAGPSDPDPGKTTITERIMVTYGPATKPFNRVMQRLLLRSGRLEQLATIWQSSVPLQPFTIAVVECERPNVQFVDGGRIELCYDLLGYLDNAFRDLSGSPIERESGVLDGMSVWLSREVARRPLNPSNLNASQSAADFRTIDDQLLALMKQGDGPSIVMAGLQWLYNQGRPEPMVMALPYWQTHQLGLAQYDRLVCKLYRQEPQRFPFLAAEYGQEKLDRCKGE